MYIATTQKKYKDKCHEQILLRESYREDGKVKTKTLLNLTNKPKEQVKAIVTTLKALKENNVVGPLRSFRVKNITGYFPKWLLKNSLSL